MPMPRKYKFKFSLGKDSKIKREMTSTEIKIIPSFKRVDTVLWSWWFYGAVSTDRRFWLIVIKEHIKLNFI